MNAWGSVEKAYHIDGHFYLVIVGLAIYLYPYGSSYPLNPFRYIFILIIPFVFLVTLPLYFYILILRIRSATSAIIHPTVTDY